MKQRIGFGYDAHRFVDDRPLILGGQNIPYEKGLLGHSDADVLAHVIMDALLGALALGSIGDHFPDTDPKFKDSNSMVLLRRVMDMVDERGYVIGNIDSVIVAQAPKLQPYILKIRQSIAECLAIDLDQVGVKATTTERMGPEGRLEGMSAYATVLVYASA